MPFWLRLLNQTREDRSLSGLPTLLGSDWGCLIKDEALLEGEDTGS